MGGKADADTRVVVMAGGQGSRFWPLSRAALPKQFLSISDDGESLIRATVRRVEPLVGAGNVRVIAKPSLHGLIREHVPTAEIFSEPAAKNTAACIGLAAVYALAEQPGKDPVLVVLPADHAIKDEAKLREALSEGISQARSSESLVTIGIPPTEPNTGYGYIKRGAPIEGRSFRVERFFEKPSLERAEKYLENGGFFWNSGMFVWRSSVILKAFQAYLPQMYDGLLEIQRILASASSADREKKIEEVFSSFESISIDFGVLEHARNCVVVCADEFGWNDVGSWDQWAQNFKVDSDGNLIQGDAIAIDSTDCVIKAGGRLVAAVGLKDIVVIDTGDAVLVVSRDSVQEVRKVVEELKKRNRTELI